MRTVGQEILLYLVFFAVLVVLIVDSIGGFFHQAWAQHIVFDLLKVFLPLILLVGHAAYTLSLPRGLGFILWLCLGGLAAEIIGLRTGILFGGFYHYLPESRMIFSQVPLFDQRFFLWGVPAPVILYWAVFIYGGYSISNSFLAWRGAEKPSYRNKNYSLLAKLVTLDAWIVLGIDLVMDPILVWHGNWQWEKPGIYFAVPGGNFIGWFMVAACLTGAFRIFEYKFPYNLELRNRLVILLPILCLGALFILAVALALNIGLYPLIPVAGFAILPIILLNFYAWSRSRHTMKTP